MKIISWNISGFRSCMKKGLEEFIKSENADIYCFQEIKAKENQITLELENYNRYIFSAKKAGYSGTMIYSKIKPINITYGINNDIYDHEGRIITLEFDTFYLINCYSPNSKPKLERLADRIEFERIMKCYLLKLSKKKNIIYCGDLNVAHEEIDVKNPQVKHKKPGFTDEERNKFSELLNCGFIDTFRYLHPKEIKYTYWSYLFNARKNNAGWRLDYFVVNNDFINKVKKSEILSDIIGSDHCPIKLIIKKKRINNVLKIN